MNRKFQTDINKNVMMGGSIGMNGFNGNIRLRFLLIYIFCCTLPSNEYEQVNLISSTNRLLSNLYGNEQINDLTWKEFKTDLY